MKQFLIASAVVAATLPALGQDYSYGRIRHVEGGATLQRASEPAAEEAFRNLPFLPGDRIWTDESGRAEFQFDGGSIVRLDARSKLDYMANEGEREGGRVVLRIWSGSLVLRSSEGRQAPDFEFETPAGVVATHGRASLRVDVGNGETRLSVYQGAASLDDGRRRVAVEAGEQTFARRGEEPERPRRLDRVADDEFARWDEDRERQIDWASAQAEERYLPEEVSPYAADLRNNGSWHADVDLGYVWQPRVGPGWQPYTFGRWAWSPYGWTWVPNETWGWAPAHYGRWGHSLSLGWYWIPGRRWSPAWVSWSHGNDYIGWAPLGRGDRAVVLGHAVGRGAGRSSWNYTRRGDFSARDLPRRRVEIGDTERQGLRVVERGYVDRSGRVVEGDHAQPKNVQVRPTPGDTIPELRADPMTTIPFPVARRRYPSEDERREREGKDLGSRVRYEQERTAQQAASDAERRRREAASQGEARTQDRERERSQPQSQSLSSYIERRRAMESATAADRERDKAQEQRERATSRERATDRERQSDKRDGESADRDVMRKVFGPISGARGRDQGDSSSGRDASAGRERDRERDKGEGARSQPRRENPRETSPPPRVEREREQRPRQDGEAGSGGGGARRKRDR
jgi:hypothetical protein